MSHNLPARLTSFIGREREIAEVGALLEAQRLVTLAGAPGVGKTRLSLQIAKTMLDAFPDGVWLVELAPLGDPGLVPQKVADVLGVREQPGRPLTTTVVEHLQPRRVLLLLDNCEHLIGRVARLAEMLLHACPRLYILATIREPLAIEGEVTRRVPSLTVPDTSRLQADREGSLATLTKSEAVRLFVERARAVASSVALTESIAPFVAQICTRLDGIPLAIELAAARARALSVEQIAARLDDRFRLLTGGSRTALPRQQTLRGAVDWSYDLLSEPEQILLRRLSVFAGGFTLEAAEAIVSGSRFNVQREGQTLSVEPETLNVVIGLVDKSLVQVVEDSDGERRYRLLETLRQYGEEKLAEHGELARVRNWHRDHFLAVAEEAEPHFTGPGQVAVLRRLDRELDNLRAALAWCHEEEVGSSGRVSGPPDRAADLPTRPSSGYDAITRLIGASWRFWWLRGHLQEVRRWLEQVLAIPASTLTPAGRAAQAKARFGAGQVISHQGDFREAIVHMEGALAFSRDVNDGAGIAQALQRLGFYRVHLGEYTRAARLCEESVALARQLGNTFELATALLASGMVAWFQSQFQRAVACHEEALALCHEIGYAGGLTHNLAALGRNVTELGNPARGAALIEEGLTIVQELGDKRGIAQAYKDLGHAAVIADDANRAVEMLHTAVPIYRDLNDSMCSSLCFHELARARTLQGIRGDSRVIVGQAATGETAGCFLDAARLYGAAAILREAGGIDFPPPFRAAYDRDLSTLREQLGEAAFDQAWAEGRAMSLEQAAAYGLAIRPASAPATPDPTPARAKEAGRPLSGSEVDAEIARLTRREQEVTALVAQGRTNRQIADELVLSERTVDTHVHNVLGKLELTSRAQVAVWAVGHGLGGSQ
jgi:predicted ATPase/DNA-binding CsgD family transcriptional regulator